MVKVESLSIGQTVKNVFCSQRHTNYNGEGEREGSRSICEHVAMTEVCLSEPQSTVLLKVKHPRPAQPCITCCWSVGAHQTCHFPRAYLWIWSMKSLYGKFYSVGLLLQYFPWHLPSHFPRHQLWPRHQQNTSLCYAEVDRSILVQGRQSR